MFATIYLPNFCLQAATRHQPELCEKPVALIEEHERKPVVIQLKLVLESSWNLQTVEKQNAISQLRITVKRSHFRGELDSQERRIS